MTEPFSTEIPELLKVHLDHLKASAISVEVIRERGYKSILGKQPLKELTFSKSQQRAPGILIPIHGVDGVIVGHQYRPDNPRTNAKDKPIKYENPAGSSVRLDVPPRCQQQLGDPGIPLWFTEGVKKVDALACAGACAVGLTGVWGFKGKNPLGGTTVLADFDYIALKGRTAYIVFDSDSATNPHVRMAMERLREHLARKGAKVQVVTLPPGPDGEKVGADDYLVQGHNLDDLIALKQADEPPKETAAPFKTSTEYLIEEGHLCWRKQTPNGEALVALCNFTARITEDITRDNGLENNRYFKIDGKLASGKELPVIETTTAGFNSLNWVTSEWGTRAIIAAGQSSKDRLREAIQLQSLNARERTIYTHTGWREIDGEMVFLSSNGATGRDDIEVELETTLQRYQLTEPSGNPVDAIKKSFDFCLVASPEVTLPLWAAMYLAPLAELIDPAFTMWLVGPSGAFKSTLTALAISHFGNFDAHHLPASWRDTGNHLEKLLFLCKDLPLVIDDWAPGQDSAKARELEVKAEYVIRAQGNRQGRGRMRSDTSSRPSYTPRGLLITSGEQLPGGHSHTARIYSVELERSDIVIETLSTAQDEQYWYCMAMSHYILWLKNNWAHLKETLPGKWRQYRDKAQENENHPRMPEVIAGLYSAVELATEFALEHKAMTSSEASVWRETGLTIFHKLASQQAGRIEEERPGIRFVELLKAMLAQGKAVLWDKDDEAPKVPAPGTVAIGWKDRDGHILLNPMAAYGAVHEFAQRSGQPFTFKESAVWKDLKRLRIAVSSNGRSSDTARVYGSVRRVIKVKREYIA